MPISRVILLLHLSALHVIVILQYRRCAYSMKKIISYILLTTILILHLGGCGTAEDQIGRAHV